MPTFAEKLQEVRKARDFTQDRLSKEMNVSRQTISHWENGRAVPDIDTIKHLSQVLDYNFLAVEGITEGTQTAPEAEEIPAQPEEKTAQETAVQQTESTPRKKRFVLPAVLGAVLLCAVLIVCLLMNGNSQPLHDEQANSTPTQQPIAQQANVIITPDQNPCPLIPIADFKEGYGWKYTICFEETAGVPFTASSLTRTYICDDDTEDPREYVVEHIVGAWGEDTLYRGAPRYWNGGMPMQGIKGIRFTLKGMDANGNELEFECYLELSKEVAE